MKQKRTGRRTAFTTCNLCEAMCGIKVEVDNDRILSIAGDRDDPFSRGHICPKAPALKELHQDPDRLRKPLRKTRTGFREVSWRDALQETAERLHGVQTRHEKSAVGVYLGNPTVHNFGAMMLGPLFLKTLRTKHRFSATSADQLPSMFASYFMLGHQLLLPVPDIDRTQYFLMLGANPLASNGSLMSAPGIKDRLSKLMARGGKLVVLDPRRTETAKIATEHHFIRPGTDAFFLASLLNTVLTPAEGSHPEAGSRSLGHLESHTRGLADLTSAMREFIPERTEALTGVPAAVTRQIASELRKHDRAVCYGRMGTSVQRYGALCQGLMNAINIVTGHFDTVGGAMFPNPALDTRAENGGLGVGMGSFARWRSSVRGLPEFGGELPVSTMAEEIDAGEIKALITMAGNPVLSTPSGNRLQDALAKLDFMVSIDIYKNETTQHADLILPPTGPLERSHFDVAFNLLSVRNTAKFSPAVLDRAPDALEESDIFAELIKQLHKLRGTPLRDRALALGACKLGPERLLDLGLRAGPYGLRARPLNGLSVGRLKQSPHGVDLGALTPQFPEKLPTGEIDLLPELFEEDVGRLTTELTRDETAGFQLIGRRHLRSNNSWMHNLPKLGAGKNRCTLLMNPKDGERLEVSSGDLVTVRSRVGAVDVDVELTDEMMHGVVSLPHGFGHSSPGSDLGVAGKRPGVSMNDLTDAAEVDRLSGNAVLTGIPVEVTAAKLESRARSSRK